MQHPTVKLSVPTATSEEVDRGLAAALAVFAGAGVTPLQAASGAFAREGWGMADFETDIADEDMKSAGVWDQAHAAAKAAACASWLPERRAEVNLDLVVDPEAQFADRETALAMLRRMADTGPRGSRDGILARIVVDSLADRSKARRLIDDVTIAFATLSTAGYYPAEPIEPKRQAVLAAIDALEAT